MKTVSCSAGELVYSDEQQTYVCLWWSHCVCLWRSLRRLEDPMGFAKTCCTAQHSSNQSCDYRLVTKRTDVSATLVAETGKCGCLDNPRQLKHSMTCAIDPTAHYAVNNKDQYFITNGKIKKTTSCPNQAPSIQFFLESKERLLQN